MKLKYKIGFVVLILAAIFSCTHVGPVTLPTGTVTLEAQSLPITKTLAWDASVNATSYTVTLDGTVIGNPVTTSQAFSIPTLGVHTFTVTASNLFGTSASATLTVNVVLPTVPSGLKIQ